MTQLPKTLHSVINRTDFLTRKITDRAVPITEELVQSTISEALPSWVGRRPTASYDEVGRIRQTSLDLSALIAELYLRGATITLPAYENRLAWEIREHQHKKGPLRRGQIVGLSAHDEYLSLGVTMFDEEVINSDTGSPGYGDYRTFLFAEHDGSWNRGWHGLRFDFSTAEASFIKRRKLEVCGSRRFKDYVHLERRKSLFGRPYLRSKLLLKRIDDRLTFLKTEVDRLKALGIEEKESPRPGRTILMKGPETITVVPTFVVKLSGPEFRGEYEMFSADEEGLAIALLEQRELCHRWRPIVQFVVRVDEIAFYRFGRERDYIAPRIKGVAWVSDEVHERGRIELSPKLIIEYQVGSDEIKVAAPVAA